jgi:hypothetical protein
LQGLSFALLHEALLSGARQPLAVPVDRFSLTGVPLAFLQEAGLGGAGKRPAVLAHRFTLASFLRRCVGEVQGQRNAANKIRFIALASLCASG